MLCKRHNLLGRVEVHERKAQLSDPKPGKKTACKIEAKPTSPRDPV